MRIGDYNSLFTINALSRTTSAIARSLQRLSTGLRVNSPQDDMAAFSEGVNLDSSVRGYTQAIRNLNDAVGSLNTASSAIGTQIEIVQKIRELAVQASSGTLSANDRAGLNSEVQALLNEYRRIATTTQFNGLNLLDGSNSSLTVQAGANAGDSYSATLNPTTASQTILKNVGTGNFQSPGLVSASNESSGVATADFNGDGKLDLVTTDINVGTISIYLGKGDGTFGTRTTFAADTHPGFVTTGDINGDGIPDILETDNTDSGISIFIGNGDGTFKPRTTLSGPDSYEVALADVNHDGKLDLIASDVSSNAVSVYLGNGNGTFANRVTYNAGGHINLVSVVDMNNDGNLDLVTNAGNQVVINYGNGNGTFTAPTTLTPQIGPYAMSVGDLNHDGIPDVVIGDANWNYEVFLANANGTYTRSVINAGDISADSILLTDVNGDGNADIVNVGEGFPKSLGILLGNGDGTFKSEQTYDLPSEFDPWGVLGDFNGDGVLDIGLGDTKAGAILNLTALVDAEGDVNVSTQSSAQKLIGIMDNLLTTLKGDQSNIAASMTRMNTSTNYANSMVQNLSDARSTALNVDIAAETSQLVRNQILQQAQVAVVGQANVNMQLVLGLLKNLGT